MIGDFSEWLNDISEPSFVWYVKRLSGNDTLANGTHQAGPYIPKNFLFKIFPSLYQSDKRNPDITFDLHIDSHNDHKNIRAVWYNNKLFGGTRNETRLTNFGGSSSALLDPDSTGALVIFAFILDNNGHAKECFTWVCRNAFEETLLEDRIGPIEPGQSGIYTPDSLKKLNIFTEKEKSETPISCYLSRDSMPDNWLHTFPTGAQIIDKTLELSARLKKLEPDYRLIKRRNCEFELFKSIEEAIELPKMQSGFSTIDSFLNLAQTVLQRRKARSGRSFELHLKAIFLEESLKENTDFSYQPESEPGKEPDFLFPSESNYKDLKFPTENLRMLAVKTTLKDRWRQVLEEADRVSKKHLITLQEGISDNQFKEITNADLQLVVPLPIQLNFSKHIRPHLKSLSEFINEIKRLQY